MRQQIYQRLRHDIQKLILKPGLSITEQQIAGELNVSRTPVREAFMQLAQEKLLDIYPQKGTVVSLIDMAKVEEGRFIRQHLEKAVVRLACQGISEHNLIELKMVLQKQEVAAKQRACEEMFRLDEEFHFRIYSSCGKLSTWELITHVNAHFNRLRMMSLAMDNSWDTVIDHHRGLIQAIETGNIAAAESIIDGHLTLVNLHVVDLKAKYPAYFKDTF
jgi:DNA-binding GntR family transcriptional regulator